MKQILKEFQKFAVKGNAVDLAVGVVIGAAFGKIVTSLVNDFINPLISLLTGNVNFADKVVVIRKATEVAEAITINYGSFIETVINFLIVTFSIFIVIRYMNKLVRKEEKKIEAKPTKEQELLTEIRDLLKNNK